VINEKAAGQLVALDEARTRLAKVASIDEAKGIRDKAEALRHYAKQQGLGLEAQNKAAEIKIRAERRAGEILAEVERTPPAEVAKRGGHAKAATAQAGPKQRTYTETIKDAGIAHGTAQRWQAEASIPEPIFEAFVATAKEHGAELTSAATLAFAKANSPDIHTDIAKSVREDPCVRWVKALGGVTDLVRALEPLSRKIDAATKKNTRGTVARLVKVFSQMEDDLS